MNDICSGKAQLEKCSAETVYRISKAPSVTMESLIEPCFDKRSDFELFKSDIFFRLKEPAISRLSKLDTVDEKPLKQEVKYRQAIFLSNEISF